MVTFDRHPRLVVDPAYVPSLLTTLDEKLPLLREAGADKIEVLHFDRALSLLSARDFMRKMREEMKVSLVVMGYDHRFGHDGSARLDYAAIAAEEGMELLRARELPHMRASSSQVRRFLLEGDAEGAARLLGYAYRLSGRVVHGRGVGRQLGFPTANMQLPAEKLVPACGAYAVRVTLKDGSRHAGMLNIGQRPTMDDGEALSVEVCLLDYEGNLYGETLLVEMAARLRGEQRFSSMGALAAQLERDSRQARALLG